jgi:hypothetical protein
LISAFGIKVGPGPGPIAAGRQESKATAFPDEGGKRVKVRYGPYLIPGIHEGDLGKQVENTGGLVWNMPEPNIEKPCSECFVTYIQAGLEDQAGNSVNTDTGLWLHHMVVFVEGPGRWDPTCRDNTTALPFLALGLDPRSSERVFPSGNERLTADINQAKDRAGYFFRESDKMHLIIELMNTNVAKKLVYMTMTYEYVPSTIKDFSNLKPVWLDIAQCGLSDVDAPKDETKYSLPALPWTSNVEGEILGVGGHVHDGGLNVDIELNKKTICDSKAVYGGRPEYLSPLADTGDKMMDMMMDKSRVHISDMGICYGKVDNLPTIKKGDVVDITGYYDYSKHAPMGDDAGNPSGVMAIAIMFVKQPFVSTASVLKAAAAKAAAAA